MDDRYVIAQRLKKAREQAGYSTAVAFCTKFNFALELYQKEEEGKEPLLASHALRYGEALGVSVYHLLLGEEQTDIKKFLQIAKKKKARASS